MPRGVPSDMAGPRSSNGGPAVAASPGPGVDDGASEASTAWNCCGGVTVQHICIRCEEETTIEDSVPQNPDKPFEKRKCRRCGATDRGLQRMFKGNKQKKQEWVKKPHPQKVDA